MSHVSTQPAHISDMMTGTVNNNAPDRSPMWKNFRDNRFNRPFMVIKFIRIYLHQQKNKKLKLIDCIKTFNIIINKIPYSFVAFFSFKF